VRRRRRSQVGGEEGESSKREERGIGVK